MKISVNWLKRLVHLPGDPGADVIAARLAGAGLAVDGATPRGAGVGGVIVVEVRGRRPHPKAEKLTLVEVFDGREVTEVVCGAPNVPAPDAAARRVLWARPGATLPGGVTIAPREIRGVVSPGMLCATDELGLGADHSGIIILDEEAAPGSDALAALGGVDTILELDVTANRPDCLGHLGVARELAALFAAEGAHLTLPDVALDRWTGGGSAADFASVTVEDEAGCPRYSARVLEDVTVGRSGLRARLLLESLGVRAISDVVDATNLVLLEMGQPLHAFDLDLLAGHRIVVRRAREGEVMVTLDEQERKLTPADLVIADAERPVALAGVMGGATSEVSATTRRILLESAYFDPTLVRRTARRFGLHTEASHRFERGVDPNDGVRLASARCARLILEKSGRATVGTLDAYPRPIAPRPVTLRPARTNHLLGTALSTDEQLRLLAALSLAPEATTAGEIACRVPTFRPDLTREVDLIEEIARLHGYDRIAPTLPPPSTAPAPPVVDTAERARDQLRGLGLAEAISFGFIAPERLIGFADVAPLRLTNPLGEELSAMRTSLVPGLLLALAQNRSRAVTDVRLFEVGAVFLPRASEPLPDERSRAAAVLAGAAGGWLKPAGEVDFYDAKGLVESLLDGLGISDVSFAVAADVPWLHPGVAAHVRCGETPIGLVGEVHPELRRRLDLGGRCFAFELELAPLRPQIRPVARDLPRFPAVERDISFFVADTVPAAAISAVLRGASSLLETVRVREDYREAGKVPPGHKGMLFSVTYRAAERTLTDDEVGKEHAGVLAALAAAHPIQPR